MTIVKTDSGYEVKSETGKNLGKATSLKGAKKRLAQVEYFKHVNEARMSAAVKLQRAFERERQKSEASRRRGEEVLKQAREAQQKKQQTNEETIEQSSDRKKQLKKFRDMVAGMGCAKSVTEGTIQPSGTDKIEVAGNEVPAGKTKEKTVKQFKFFTQESWTFDTAAMAKQELADAKNKKHRKRGKVANLLRKLGMKEEVEITEANFNAIMAQIKKKQDQAKREARMEAGKTQGNNAGAWGKLTPKALARIERAKKFARNEEYELQEDLELDEAFDPSEVAGNPKMYSADTVKKAYYHKKASDGDKESLARHLDRHHGNKEWRKPVKEEQEQIDELSRDTLLSYANKVSLDSQKHSKDPTKRSGAKASRSVTGYAKAHDRLEKPVKEEAEQIDEAMSPQQKSDFDRMMAGAMSRADYNAKWKKPLKSDSKVIYGKNVKEEAEQIDEVNHREYASAGKMHPTMAKHMTAGQETDFYHSSTGDKLSGVVKHKSDKEVHIKAHKDGKMGAGEMHKFQISEELKGGQANLDKNKNGKLDKQDFKLLRTKLKEAKLGKPVDVDKVHAAGDEPHEEKWEDAKTPKTVKKESFTADELLQALKEGLWPGTPEHKAKFGDKYAQKQGGGAGVKKGTRYGGSLQKPEKEDDNDADDKPAKKNK